MAKAIVFYLSYSGNTKEVAELIKNELDADGFTASMCEIGWGEIPDLSPYQLIFIGTFTWDYGEVPHEVKDFVADLGYKPSNVYIYGTGDTQFGGDALFCKAADKLARFYHSPVAPLKIEQSPRGSQQRLVSKWVQSILEAMKETEQSG